MFRFLIFSVSCIFIFIGCGLRTYNSSVLEVGPDTYFVSANDLNISIATKEALTLANDYCKKLGKEILVTEKKSRIELRSFYEVTFMCLNKNDYELTRPKYEKTPDVIIENRVK